MNHLMKALIAKLRGDIEVHKANILIYVRNPAGIGEHPDLVAAIDTQIERIAHAEDKLSVLRDRYL